MEYTGRLFKMSAEMHDPVLYRMKIENEEILLNDYIGKNILLEYTGKINCILCNRATSKSFFQGMCYPCFQSAPEAEDCILRPELCRAHEGIARDMGYARINCLQEHFVYLSYTGGLKVGVTRKSQIPIRWIDQGATVAVKIASVPNRYTAGLIETELKKYYADKTNWRKMLNEQKADINVQTHISFIRTHISDELEPFILKNQEINNINYPVEIYPEKVKSVSFDKSKIITGILSGIKGQYLIFNDNRVLNIRKHGGYIVTLRL